MLLELIIAVEPHGDSVECKVSLRVSDSMLVEELLIEYVASYLATCDVS